MGAPYGVFTRSDPSKLPTLENTSIFPSLLCLGKTLRDKEKKFADKVSVIVSICPSVAEFILTQQLPKATAQEIIEIVYYGVAEVVLNCRWLKTDMVTKNHVIFTLNKFLNYSKAINSRNHTKLIAYLILLVKDPWGSSTLNQVMRDEELKSIEIKRFFQQETIFLVGLRVLSLVDSESEDLALKLVSFVVKYCGLPIKTNINLFIRIITNVINQMEVAEAKGNHEKVRKIEKKLCSIYLVLFNTFRECKGISRETILTAFSLEPHVSVYKLIELCKERDSTDSQASSHQTDEKADDKESATTSFGALSPETGTCFTESADYDPSSAPNDITNDCERLNFTKQNIGDLISIISYPRYKRLSWAYEWEILKKTCEDFMKNGETMKNPEVELKHLKIDFNQFLENNN